MKVIEKTLCGKRPPKTNNVFWLDTSNSEIGPILKCHYHGQWVPVLPFYLGSGLDNIGKKSSQL